MIRLEQLPQVAEETLGGLKAGPRLPYSAPRPAASRVTPQGRALAFALSLMMVLSLSALLLRPGAGQPIPQVNHLQAGDSQPLPEGVRSAADVPQGSLVLSEKSAPEYQGVWARGSGGNFPLIGLDGRYYRLLRQPGDVASLTGQALGQVRLATGEPALERGGGIISSVVATAKPFMPSAWAAPWWPPPWPGRMFSSAWPSPAMPWWAVNPCGYHPCRRQHAAASAGTAGPPPRLPCVDGYRLSRSPTRAARSAKPLSLRCAIPTCWSFRCWSPRFLSAGGT